MSRNSFDLGADADIAAVESYKSETVQDHLDDAIRVIKECRETLERKGASEIQLAFGIEASTPEERRSIVLYNLHKFALPALERAVELINKEAV